MLCQLSRSRIWIRNVNFHLLLQHVVPLVKRNQLEAWRYAIRFASSQSAGWERKGAYKDRKADGYLVLFPKLLLSLAFSVKRVLPLVALLPVSFCELLVCCLLLVLEFKSPVVSKHDQGPVHTVICHTNAYRHIVCNLVHFEDKGFTRTFGYIMIARVESRLICLVVENSLWEVICRSILKARNKLLINRACRRSRQMLFSKCWVLE